MSGLRDELKEMSRGFRWGRRPLVPRSAEPFVEEKDDIGFPTDWARTQAGTAARQAILKGFMHPLLKNELSLRVFGLDNLTGVDAPVVFFSNHSSHLDATLILTTLPDVWQAKTAVGAARDYFFDVWWRQAFTALVYGAFPIDRSRGGRGAVDKARELIDDGWSLVVFPEGTQVPGRSRATVPARDVAPVPRARDRRRAHRDPRRASGHAQGAVLAEGRPSHRHGPVRHAAVSGGGRDASGLLPPDGAGGRSALRRGPVDVVGFAAASRARRDAVARRTAGPRLAEARGRAHARSRAEATRGPGSRLPCLGPAARSARARWSRRPSASSVARGTTARASDQIATAVGVRKQTLLYYFPTKDALLEACLSAAGERLVLEIAQALEGKETYWDRAEAVIHSVFSLAEQWPEFPMFIREAGRLGPDAFARFAGVLDPLRLRAIDFLQAGMDTGEIRKQDPAMLLFTLYTGVVGSLTEASVLNVVVGADKGRASLKRREREVIAFVRAAMMPPAVPD